MRVRNYFAGSNLTPAGSNLTSAEFKDGGCSERERLHLSLPSLCPGKAPI